jgi:hypothetical protein
MLVAGSNGVADTIAFDIPANDPGCDGQGVCTIKPGSLLAGLYDDGSPTILDGYTQSGASPNTGAFGDPINASIKVALDGQNAVAYGVWVQTPNHVIRGIAVYGFTQWGIYFGTGSDNGRVEGSFIGTLPSGMPAASVSRGAGPSGSFGGSLVGVYAAPAQGQPALTNVTIGGPDAEDRNLISGNVAGGVDMVTTNSTVQGNYIGTDSTGEDALPNGQKGVRFFATSVGNTIEENLIAFNPVGIRVEGAGAIHNTFTRNSIHSNDDAGIIISGGGNEDLAAPVITGFGSVSGTACASCTIEVFSDDEDQGRTYEGSTVADGAGGWTFGATPAGPNVTATATDAAGNTSEFSEPVSPGGPTPTPTPSPTPTPVGPTPTPTPAGPTPTPTPTPAPEGLTQGDNDCDGDSDAVDALVSLQSTAGLPYNQTGDCPDLASALPAGGEAQLFGDIDCDGDVDAVDALQILRNVAGLPVNQEEGCPEIGEAL